MRQAFTMIELIFVIVIIGILASVAIPKLAASIDDADSSICALEVAQLTRELANSYSMFGHTLMKSKMVSEMTNIVILTNAPDKDTGIIADNTIVTGIEYQCDGIKIANFIYSYDATILRYGLTLQISDGRTPASLLASIRLRKNLAIIGTDGKYYIF